jgi:ABC-2 type transport system permease protein
VARNYSAEVVVKEAERLSGRTVPEPLDVRPRVWFNEDLQSRNYIIPGLIAVIMMVLTALLTSLTVAREWEQGTMEQLIATPVKRAEVIFGKMIPYFLIGMFDVALAAAMGQFLFHVPFRGSLPLLFITAAVFLIGVLSFGIFISVTSRTQRQANQLATLITFLPSYLLSGFVFPIYNMPRPIQVITNIVPAKYFIVMLKGIYLKGVGLDILWFDGVLLVAFGAAMLTLAIVKFKKRLT